MQIENYILKVKRLFNKEGADREEEKFTMEKPKMKKCPHVKVGESSPWSLLFFGLATAGLFKVGMFLIWLASYEKKQL